MEHNVVERSFGTSGDPPQEMPICPSANMNEIVGKVLTLMEATIPTDNREAAKSMGRQLLWDWYSALPGYTTILSNETKDATINEGVLNTDNSVT